jgi:hypothetical protein
VSDAPIPQRDTPIKTETEDRLGRHRSAAAFARALLKVDAAEGAVVGVLGPWGSGKTSFINLARTHLESENWTILDFNPWMFSGVGQLVDSFFAELASQLRTKTKFTALADAVTEYGDVFATLGSLPMVGPWVKVASAVGRQVRRGVEKRQGVKTPQEAVRAHLSKLDNPIAVVIDDIDRLPTADIRDIFKLVRLTGNFPNLVYILAFDRARVERALTEDGIPGRDYLEKILFWTVDLPVIPSETLVGETLNAIQAALADVAETGPFEADRWADVFAEIVRPLIRQIRDVRRYAVAVRASAAELGREVALVDVLALEAVRVFLPDTFMKIASMVAELTTPSGSLAGVADATGAKPAIDAFVQSAEPHEDVARNLIHRVFPTAQRYLPQGSHYTTDWAKTWLRSRRVAHVDLLRLYLERVAGESLAAFSVAEQIVAVLGDKRELDKTFAALDPARRSAVIVALETWEDEFPSETVVPASVVLLNLLPDVAEGGGGMFALRPDMVVSRVVLRLLRRLPNAAAVKSATDKILSQVTKLSARLLLIRLVGHVEGSGHKLIESADAALLEREWRDQVRAADAATLEGEWDLLRLLYTAKKDASGGEAPLAIPSTPGLTRAIIRSSAGTARRQTMGNRALKSSTRLAWDALVEVIGGEDQLKARLRVAKKSAPQDDAETLRLVDRYLSGWRPKDFDPLDSDD